MSLGRRALLALSALGLVAFLFSPSPSAQAADEQGAAIAAAEAWLKLVDAKRYDQSWDDAASFFRDSVKKGQWAEMVAGVRGPLGAVKSRRLASATPYEELPGAPKGRYVVIQYKTDFAGKPGAIETVTPMKDTDGQWRVSGYYIK